MPITGPMTVQEMQAKIKPGQWVEYFCPVCKRRVTSKYAQMVHQDDETAVCGHDTYLFKFRSQGDSEATVNA